MSNSITRVAIVGSGVIGASWASYFLAQGLDVIATDPAPGAEARLRAMVASHWPALEMLGLAEGADQKRLHWAADLASAVADVPLVLENGPERLEVKRALFRELDAAARPDAILASSSSTLMPSEYQSECTRPERVVLAHPFNPPHLIPLVEVVGGEHTSEEAVTRTVDFFHAVGKKPIRLKREIRGHIANRLQAALWQEAFALVEAGVASVADVDTAIAHGPGLRWALLGPFLNLHLSGGPQGLAHVLAHLGPPTETMWRDLGTVHLNPTLNETLVAGVVDELAGLSFDEMLKTRDAVLQQLIKLKAAAGHLP
jgi:carnitine 3-dehydrogenase